VTKGIDKRPSGLYRVRVQGFASKSFHSLADAREHQRTLTRARETGREDQVGTDLIKLRELASEWAAATEPNLARATKASYRVLWKAHVLTHHIANQPIRAITPKVVESFRDDLTAGGTGPSSVTRVLMVFQSVMDRAVLHGRIAYNPVKPVKPPKRPPKRAIRPLSPAQVERLRGRLSGADATLVSVLAYSGMRPQEARALVWSDIGERTILVDKAAEEDGTVKATKTGENRSARLVAPLAADLAAFRLASGNPADSALIFPRADGTAWTYDDYRNWAKRAFRNAATAAGVEIKSPYHLRHAAASLWLREGVDVVRVAKWLGHSPAVCLKHYAHVIDDMDDGERRSADDVITAARTTRSASADAS
jgi:integrase